MKKTIFIVGAGMVRQWRSALRKFLMRHLVQKPFITMKYQIAEPSRKNYATLHKGLCILETPEASKFARNVR